MTVLKKFIVSFSYVFHPLFIPLYACFFYLFSDGSLVINREKVIVFSEVFMIMVLVPLLVFLLLRSIGKIDSVMVPKVSERKIPLVIQCFLIILLLKKGITIERYLEFHFFFLGALVSTLIALMLLFVNFKVSLHMIGISALAVFVFGLSVHFQTHNTFWIAFLVLMNGMVAFSRLEMRAHTPWELILGVLTGSVPQILLLYLWL